MERECVGHSHGTEFGASRVRGRPEGIEDIVESEARRATGTVCRVVLLETVVMDTHTHCSPCLPFNFNGKQFGTVFCVLLKI